MNVCNALIFFCCYCCVCSNSFWECTFVLKPNLSFLPTFQSELRHGPFYYMKQPLTTDPVDVVPQDGRNDFYCWVCHREGQVLCCELCPRVYHAKCLRLTSEPEGDWFCPECEKITVAECIETQSKAMMMLTIEQLSYLLKFTIQKMKQPGTDEFQKPVPLEQHPDYAEYIFHPMDLCTLEKVGFHQRAHSCRDDSRFALTSQPCLNRWLFYVSPAPLLFGWKNAHSPNFFVIFSQGLQWALKPTA